MLAPVGSEYCGWYEADAGGGPDMRENEEDWEGISLKYGLPAKKSGDEASSDSPRASCA